MVMIQQLQERSDRSRSRSPPDDSTQDEQDRGGNAGHDGPSSARKKREELSYEEHRIQSQLRRFVYFDRAFVPATILADIFLGEKGEEDQANVFDLLSEVFGTEDLDDLDIRKQVSSVTHLGSLPVLTTFEVIVQVCAWSSVLRGYATGERVFYENHENQPQRRS
jgi:hypothetical protein